MRPIDTHHLGHRRAICCWQVGEVLIDPGPTNSLDTVLAALDGVAPRAILLTHIHFDHAASTGTLMRMYPELELYVHERGAPHMIDPERLWNSASRLYGADNMLALWGEFVPAPAERVHALAGGETLRFGDDSFEVAYTPGHAKHHVSYLHQSGTAFVGDVGGVRVEQTTLAVPPTPPPDIDADAWHASLDLIRAWGPQRLALTHFGAYDDVERQLDEVGERLDRWVESTHDADPEAWVAGIEAEIRARTSPDLYDSYLHAVPIDQAYMGLRRYWDKREQAASS